MQIKQLLDEGKMKLIRKWRRGCKYSSKNINETCSK